MYGYHVQYILILWLIIQTSGGKSVETWRQLMLVDVISDQLTSGFNWFSSAVYIFIGIGFKIGVRIDREEYTKLYKNP